jgi:hypothetical protein
LPRNVGALELYSWLPGNLSSQYHKRKLSRSNKTNTIKRNHKKEHPAKEASHYLYFVKDGSGINIYIEA